MVYEVAGDVPQNHAGLEFDKLLSEASADFIRATGDEIDSEITKWLRRASLTFGTHKATLVQLDPTDGRPRATHQWAEEGILPNDLAVAPENYPWLKSKILCGETIILDDHNDAPPEASADLQQARHHGGKATVSVPLRVAGQLAGAVVFTSSVIRSWSPEIVQQLTRISEMFGIALERKRSQTIIRKLREEIRDVLRIVPMAEVTSALAHELNQPLGAILNNSQAARRLLRAKRPDLEELKDAVEAIIGDVERASNIVRQTRAAFRSVSEMMGPVELREVLLDVERVLRNDARARSISLYLSIPTSLPCVMANRKGLLQVLMNLVLNAFDSVCDYSEGPREVEMTAIQDGDEIRVGVRDTGPGIDPQIRPRLFTAFVTNKSKGTGMGLAIARSIIEKSGGRIWAAPTSGPGTTIEFALPVSASAPTSN
jgi:signal transduction histidine kinase